MQYRKKPVVIEAVQWNGDEKNYDLIKKLQTTEERKITLKSSTRQVRIETLEGIMFANIGDWIIRGVAGEVYPCKPDIFEKTYEPVTSPPTETPNVGIR